MDNNSNPQEQSQPSPGYSKLQLAEVGRDSTLSKGIAVWKRGTMPQHAELQKMPVAARHWYNKLGPIQDHRQCSVH